MKRYGEQRGFNHSHDGEPEEVRRAREYLVRKLGGPGYGDANIRSGTENRPFGQSDYSAYETFLEKLRRLVARKRTSFRSQLSVYVGVNGFLFVLNVMGGGLFFPWFLFPAGAMGLGLLNSYTSLQDNRKVLSEAEQLPPMSAAAVDEFRVLKKHELRSRSMRVHFIGLGGFLLMINAITSPGVPWALIPVGIMGAAYMSRRGSAKVKHELLRDNFERCIGNEISGGSYRRSGAKEAVSGYELEAQAAADAVISRLKKLEDVQQLPQESADILNTYLDQVKILSSQAREIDVILREIPRKELAADRKKLEDKIARAGSEQLAAEYERSLREIHDHERAYDELEEQREVIELRILSAINNLKKLRLDVARINSIAQMSSMTNFADIKRQSRELSDYINDLADGYREADEAARPENGGLHE